MATQNQTLGRGEIHFAPFKAGTLIPDGYRYLGNTPEFNLSVTSESLPHYTMDRGTKIKDKSVNLQTDFAGTFTCDDISMDNLALFFLGSASRVAQASATAETETIADVKLGRSYQIGETDALPMGVKSVTISAAVVGATPLVAGTDYELDGPRGIITILEGATNVNDGDDVEITYDLAAVSYDRTISGNKQIEGAIRYLAYNAEGEDVDYRMAHVRISPNGDLPLKGDDWMTTPFNVEIIKPAGREAIYANGQPFVVTP
jgi:hypothetical protein